MSSSSSCLGQSEIGALHNLLREHQEKEDVLGPSQTQVVSVDPAAAAEAFKLKKKKEANAIWQEDEIPSEDALGFMFEPTDERQSASFEMVYKQLVNSEDVYLGTEKTPSSCHCDAIVYKISFPGHRHAELAVEVTRTTLRAESSRLKLALYLPQPVVADRGKAEWDAKTSVLSITLPLATDEW
ncbi:hypothetical protein CTAYLR_002861 [Chrysophaeum taylorii]|uniref:PIH1D1/2/3 CS-like domain-containing protein n=1 Tax=Chrysophaeum taylorii TaxID=2483200 RepID=A0AAD7U8V1_9STRA|nr:hypothetical protein CTAYLR_002861 [Chrysophaeum taylorii]